MISIAKFLTDFKAVVLGLLIFIAYRYFEVQSLFYRYLPLEGNVKLIASILIAAVIVFALLIFSAHIPQFKLGQYDTGNWIKTTLFFFTLFINAFFWQIWIVDDTFEASSWPGLAVGFKITITLFIAIFDFAFNHLFVSLWAEKLEEGEVKQTITHAMRIAGEKKQIVADLEVEASKMNRAVSEQRAKLSELIARSDPKVCPRCLEEFPTANHRNGHLRGCSVKLN
jgi:hypothetical protein